LTGSPPDRPAFFIEANTGGQKLARALRDAGYEVHLHNEHLPEGTDDVSWIRFAAERNWIAITRDKRIRSSPLELNALLTAGLAAFFISSGELTGDEIRDRLLKFLPQMLEYWRRTPRPFLATVTASGIRPLR